MRKLYSLTFMSLDGVMEAPDRWHFAYYSDQMGQELRAQLESAGAMLLGRVTYQEFAAYWPQQPPDAPFADLNNTIRKYVVSTTLDRANWNNTTLINRNIPEAIHELKRQPGGDLHLTGSATLVRSLLEAGLLDELRIQLSPVIVGSGKRLFRDGAASMGLQLAESKTLPHGVLALAYRPTAR
jgi:dihydrofolate reductase